MRILLLAGSSMLALTTPVAAQQSAEPIASESLKAGGDGQLDTLVDDGPAVAAVAPPPTGDPVLDRLNQLESRIKQLEARNAQLEQQAELNDDRLATVETRAAKAVQFTWGPTLAEPTGQFSFKPRGVLEADTAAFFERKGGYDYNNGTAFRRARLGFEGNAYKWFNYRLEVDFAGNQVGLTDAYLQYTKIPKTV